MKNPLLYLILLCCNFSYAQHDTPITGNDSQPITTTGISLPQLITTDINRSELQFHVDLSNGLEAPNLTANYQKFVSDKRKQFTLSASTNVRHQLSFSQTDQQDFYTFHNIGANLNANLKLFTKKNYFLELSSQNQISKSGDLTNFDYYSGYNNVGIGIGKGRIDFVNDGSAAVSIVEKLEQYKILKRPLNENEYSQLTEKIRTLKNRRKFVNRSYPLTEIEEIQDLLLNMEVIPEEIDVTEIINDAYRFEPMLNRTVGSQFKLFGNTSFGHNNFASKNRNVGVSLSLSYMIHNPISTNWQYNNGVTAYTHTTDFKSGDPLTNLSRFERTGVGLKNDIHYLVDNRMRFSLLTTTGYDFVNESYTIAPFLTPKIDNKGFYLNLRSQFEYHISRTMSTTFGINLNFTPGDTYTGMSFGLNF